MFFIDFRKDGKRVRLSTGTQDRAEAERLAPELVARALAETPTGFEGTAVPSRRTLGAAIAVTYETVWKHQRGADNMAYRVKRLLTDVGDLRLDELSYQQLNAQCLTWRTAGDSPATLNRKISAISRALTEASKLGWIDKLPKMPRFAEDNVRERYLTRAEEAALLKAIEDRVAPAYPEFRYLRDLVVFLVDTGLRLGEALALTEDNVQGKLVTLRHGKTKSGKGRSVPMTSRAQEALQGMLAYERHGKITEAWLYRRWNIVRTEAGLGDVTMHTLRHTCASRLVQGGVDLYRVRAWLGHASITTSMRYAHLRVDDLDGAVGTLEQGNGHTDPKMAQRKRGNARKQGARP